MLFFLSNYEFLHILKYISFRSLCAMFTALFISLMFGSYCISVLRKWQVHGQPIRLDGPDTHQTKSGTPTMGGILILLSIIISALLWSDISNIYVLTVLMITIAYGFLGFADDYLKIKKRNSKGVSAKTKMFVQILFGAIATIITSSYSPSEFSNMLSIPFLKNFLLNLSVFYIVFGAIVITGTSNAVNLTDGLDGLSIGPIMICITAFGIISYLVGHHQFASYLYIPYIPKASELSVICASVVGAGLGFLWFNAPPAQVFMGDVGSLALGGMIGTISVITKNEILLVIIGGLFVLEAVSVILQVASFKLRGGKRIFKMAPIHHHFEKCGWPETRVVFRFWIISIVFAIIGLATLKMR